MMRIVLKLPLKMLDVSNGDHSSNNGSSCEKGESDNVKKEEIVEETCVEEDEECEEGGWGYVVCLGLAVIFINTSTYTEHFLAFICYIIFTTIADMTGQEIIGIAPLSSIGLLYEDFLMSIGEVTSGLTITFGLGNAMLAFAGMLTTCALKKFTLRQVGLFGSALYTIASFLAIFVNSMPTFVFVNGFIQPIGFGIMMPISLTCFNTYFNKKRALMMSIVSVMVGAGAMIFPILVEKMMENYGFKGTLAMMCAINMHVIPSIAIMRPVEWKRKRVHKAKEQKKGRETVVRIEQKNLDENYNDGCVTTANEPLLSGTKIIQITKDVNKSSDPEFCRRESINNKFLSKPKEEEIRARMLRKRPSIASLGNRVGNSIVTEAFQSEGTWKKLVNLLDLTLFKDPVYINICLGMTLSVFADMTFFTLEPSILTSLGYDKMQIAYCVAVGAFADLISRIIFAIASFYIKLKSRIVFFFGNTFMIIFRIVFMQWTDIKYLMAVTGCLGFFRHWILMSAPLVFADQYGIEKFPAAYGLNMMVSGISNLILGPLTGIIKDIFNDFNFVVGYLVVCSLLCTVPWSIEFMFQNRQRKSKILR